MALGQELRKLAAAKLNRERGARTLQPTVLIHEAYLKLVQHDQEPTILRPNARSSISTPRITCSGGAKPGTPASTAASRRSKPRRRGTGRAADCLRRGGRRDGGEGKLPPLPDLPRTGRWDGSNLRDLTEPPEELHAALVEQWGALYGPETFSRAEWWAAYVLPFLGPHRAEPFMNQTPRLFTATPPGWSTISDGLPFPNLDPMRGVISTDTFPAAPVAHQFQTLGAFRCPAGAPTGRMLPVPRELLQPGWRFATL